MGALRHSANVTLNWCNKKSAYRANKAPKAGPNIKLNTAETPSTTIWNFILTDRSAHEHKERSAMGEPKSNQISNRAKASMGNRRNRRITTKSPGWLWYSAVRCPIRMSMSNAPACPKNLASYGKSWRKIILLWQSSIFVISLRSTRRRRLCTAPQKSHMGGNKPVSSTPQLDSAIDQLRVPVLQLCVI